MIVPVQYTKAISPVCKSLAFLAEKKRQEEADDYQIDFTVQGEVFLCQRRQPQFQSYMMYVILYKRIEIVHSISFPKRAWFI